MLLSPRMDEDLGLLDRWREGDQTAGNELFRRHFTALYKFFNYKTGGDVDDLVQKTLLECVKSRDLFKRQSSFRTYLFAIARHVLFRHWRSNASTREMLDVDDISVEALTTSVGSRLARNSEKARLSGLLRTLPIDQQLLLEMYYWHEMDREQLAEVFDVETATIGSRLHRARQSLKDSLDAQSGVASVADLDSWARSLARED